MSTSANFLRICRQKVVKAGAVDRLTDVSKFTGSHKERFTEDGKGKGIHGRKDVADTSGYVSGFKKEAGGDAAAAATPTTTASAHGEEAADQTQESK